MKYAQYLKTKKSFHRTVTNPKMYNFITIDFYINIV